MRPIRMRAFATTGFLGKTIASQFRSKLAYLTRHNTPTLLSGSLYHQAITN